MTSTSLVTGGAGFMGSHVAAELLHMGHRVVVLDDLSGGTRDNVPDGAEFVVGSVCDPSLVDRLFAEHRFTHVFHLAAYAAEGLSHFIKRFNYTNNVLGSVNLINASVNTECVQRFVFTSSIAVYGAGQLPMTEDLVPAPEDSYGIAKHAVEQELRISHEMFGLDYTIFRPHNVYGERQNIGDRYRNVIGIFMNQLMRDEPLTVFGDGTQTRAFSYIDDVAIPIAHSIDVPAARNETFNIGGDTPYSVNDLVHAVADAMRTTAEVRHLPARNEVVHAYSTHTKARDVLGVTSTVTLSEGLTRMGAWASKLGPQEPQRFDGVEVVRNMPPSWRELV